VTVTKTLSSPNNPFGAPTPGLSTRTVDRASAVVVTIKQMMPVSIRFDAIPVGNPTAYAFPPVYTWPMSVTNLLAGLNKSVKASANDTFKITGTYGNDHYYGNLVKDGKNHWMFLRKGEVEKDDGFRISWGTNANKEVVTQKSLDKIKSLLKEAGLTSCMITSTLRSSADQARAMYDNILVTGIDYQKELYSYAGNQVIAVYEASKNAGKTATQIKADMSKKIDELLKLGYTVGKHCVPLNQYKQLNVIDIGYASIANLSSFRTVLQKAENNKTLANFLDEPDNYCFHIEISQ